MFWLWFRKHGGERARSPCGHLRTPATTAPQPATYVAAFLPLLPFARLFFFFVNPDRAICFLRGRFVFAAMSGSLIVRLAYAAALVRAVFARNIRI